METQIFNRRIPVDGVDIFYREAGDPKNPSMLLLHGFPTPSIMFKNLMVALADRYHLVAPDYPGFGFSAFPDREEFEYSFDNVASCMHKFTDAIGLTSFTIYLHDYGCPIGLRICMKSPERIEGLIVQNGSSYMEGIGPQWDEVRDYWDHPTEEKKKKVSAFISKEGIEWQYTAGLPKEMMDRVSPELAVLDWTLMSRPGNVDMHFEMNCTYKSNLELYPAFQEYFRKHQPPAIVIWGKYDVFFSIEEPPCYKRDLRNVSVHIIDGGHHALETNFDEVLRLIEEFMFALKPVVRY